MDEQFQDRIDSYLLGRMDDAEKPEFLREVEQDEKKKEQLEFTKNVKDAICSREMKLQAMAQFRSLHEKERSKAAGCDADTGRGPCGRPAPKVRAAKPVWPKKTWLWVSGVAAVLAGGFFAIRPMLEYGEPAPGCGAPPVEQVRGGHEVFGAAPADSTDNDTTELNLEEEVTPDE